MCQSNTIGHFIQHLLIFFLFAYFSVVTNYIFDSNSAVRLPKNIVGTNWEDTLTIAAWVLVKISLKPQFILSWSDGRQLGSTYMGLFVINKGSGEKPRIGFVMNKNNGKCRFNEEWNIELWDFSWRHVAVVVSGCNLQVRNPSSFPFAHFFSCYPTEKFFIP